MEPWLKFVFVFCVNSHFVFINFSFNQPFVLDLMLIKFENTARRVERAWVMRIPPKIDSLFSDLNEARSLGAV